MSTKKVFFLATLGSLLLLAGLLPLFGRLCQVEIAEPGGWFAEPAAYTIVHWGSAWAWSLFFTLSGGGILYAILQNRLHYRNAIPRLLRRGQFSRAWNLAVRCDEFSAVEKHLEKRIPLLGAELKRSVLTALEHLRRLRAGASDPLNQAVPGPLREAASAHADQGLLVLGEIVGRLDLLQRQEINPQQVSHRLQGIQRTVEHLAETTEAARVRLAHLSLGSERDDAAEEAAALMRQVSQAAEDLHRFDNAVSGLDSSGSNPAARLAE